MNPGYDMTLFELKDWNKKIINEIRDEKLIGGYTDISNVTWGNRPVDIINLSGLCTLIALGVVTENQTWRDQANVNHTMTPAELVALAGALAYFSKLCYVSSWEHKEVVDAMYDIQTLLDYDVTQGWPS